MLSEEEVNETAKAAVATWIKDMSRAGFKSVPAVNQREDGRALEQSVAIYLDTLAIDFYPEYAARFAQAGLHDADLQKALKESLHRINVQVLRRLLTLGFRVEKLLSLCESGEPFERYFTRDHH